MARRITHIVFHTAAYRGDVSAEEIDRWHKDRGWDGIGYHYVIRKNGVIEPGREEKKIGAHCIENRMNHKSIGICIAGHGNHERWTAQQCKSFVWLFRELNNRYGILPKNVIGHREAGANKDCPGTLINCDEVRAMLLVQPNRNQFPND